jgi:hypothetical protein
MTAQERSFQIEGRVKAQILGWKGAGTAEKERRPGKLVYLGTHLIMSKKREYLPLGNVNE